MTTRPALTPVNARLCDAPKLVSFRIFLTENNAQPVCVSRKRPAKTGNIVGRTRSRGHLGSLTSIFTPKHPKPPGTLL